MIIISSSIKVRMFVLQYINKLIGLFDKNDIHTRSYNITSFQIVSALNAINNVVAMDIDHCCLNLRHEW